MKNTCKPRRNAFGFGVFALTAIFTFMANANPFNDGTTNNITSDTDYNETLYVGIQNPDNTLVIGSNATVSATEVIVGQLTSSTNNLISVLGGSRLVAGDATTNGLTSGGIVVGANDGDAAINLNNASAIEADYLYIGFGTNDSGKIEMAGEGTGINVASNAFIGYAGSTNTINVGAGSALHVGGDLNVGFAGGSNNTVTVKSGGSLFVNSTNNINVVDSDADNSIKIQDNGTLQVGADVETGTLEADLGVELASNAKLEVGGELILTGNEINDRLAVTLNGTLSTNTATWSSSSVTKIGDDGSNNSLTLTNGATATSGSILQIGSKTAAQNNSLIVGGTGSAFTGLSDVMVGAQGKNNNLTVGDGGQATIAGNLYLGNNIGATGNEVNIASNGVLNVGTDVMVGDYGSGNRFEINYGQVAVNNDFILGASSANNRYNQTGGTNTVSGDFIIGKNSDATGKTGHVDDDAVETTGNLAMVEEDAVLNIGSDLTVGRDGGGSIMTIRDGGVVNVDGDTTIGEAVGDNYIYLQRDAETRFNAAGDLIVGKEGGSNRFAVYGGTADIGGNLYLGATTNQHEIKNFIHLETTNAVLNVANSIHIGASNSFNTLDLVDGATATARDLFVGTFEGISNNAVTVTGENSLLHITNTLAIGTATGSDNSVVVENGGTLSVDQANITLSGTNNTLEIADGGTLKTGDWDFSLLTGSATNILFDSGSTLHMLGMLSGTNMVEGGLNFVLDGTNSSWNTGTNEMFVGFETGNNSLTITNGASAGTLTNLYIGFASENNTVTVGGTGSVLNVGHDLFVGNIDTNDSGFGNLFVLDGAMVNVGNDALLAHGAILDIDSDSKVNVAGNYEQDVYSELRIGVSSNQVNPNLVVGGTAEFTNDTTIAVYDDGIGDNTNVVQNVVQAGSITVGDVTATTLLLNSRLNIETNSLLSFTASISNDTTFTWLVLDNFIKRSIGEAAELEGQLLDIANEIDDLVKDGNEQALSMRNILGDMDTPAEQKKALDNYYGERKSSAPSHNAINMGMQAVAGQLTMRADNTRARNGSASAAINWNKSAGVAGPHMQGQELQGWLMGYGTWADMSESDGFNGYDASINGFMVGADLSVAENILFGLAGGRGRATIDMDNDAETKSSTSYGSIYLSTGTKSWFADASFIYGGSTVDTELGPVFDTEAEFDAQNYAFYLGGGKEFTGDYLIITPQASLLCNYYTQDAYEEESTTAVGREVDDFDALYIQSSLGLNVGMYLGMGNITLKPEFRVAWQHEFNAEEEEINYSLIGGTGNYNLQLQAPEEDIFKIGVGASAKLGEYLELRADLDSRLSSNYSDTTLLGSLRYQF